MFVKRGDGKILSVVKFDEDLDEKSKEKAQKIAQEVEKSQNNDTPSKSEK